MKEPTHDTPRAKMLRLIAPGYSWCLRCGVPWKFTREHVTNYSSTSGIFPLCKYCWTLLGSPEARIEYYKMLVDDYEAKGYGLSNDAKMDIQRAVANGE